MPVNINMNVDNISRDCTVLRYGTVYGTYYAVWRYGTDIDICCFVYMNGTYYTVPKYNMILGLGYGINIYYDDILSTKHTTKKNLTIT